MPKEMGSPQPQERDHLVNRHIRQVNAIAGALVKKGLNMGVEELRSAGAMGLLQAIDNFDPASGNKLTTYAGPKIMGAMLDEARRNDSLPSWLRRYKKKVEKVKEKLYFLNGRNPTEEETAEELGVDIGTHRKNIRTIFSNGFLSFPTSLKGGDLHVDTNQASPESMAIGVEQKRLLAKAIAELPEQWRKIVEAYFFDDLKMREIAKKENLTKSSISIIIKNSLKRLYSALEKTR